MRLWSRTLLALACGLVAAAPAAAQPVPSGYTYHDEYFPSEDGTQLHAGVFLPADREPGERHPVLLVATPYAGSNGGTTAAGNTEGPVVRFPELFHRDYLKKDRWAYVQVDVRGFGGSHGCFDYYGPHEAGDVAASARWAASREWSIGPVGMWGKSYDAATQVLALAKGGDGVAATVIQAPGLSAYTALWMNGVHYATGRYATTGVYTAEDLLPSQNADTASSPDYASSNLAPVTSLPGQPTCRTDALLKMNLIGDRSDPFWTGREVYLGAKGSTVPTFWTHGFYDANTKPVHMDVWASLQGPKHTWLGGFTHKRGQEAAVGGRARSGEFLPQAWRFLDRYVRGETSAVVDPAVVVQESNGAGRWRTEQQWPPADAEQWAMPLNAGSYQDVPGGSAGSAAGTGVWTFTPPLGGDAHLAGEMQLDVPVSTTVAGAHLVALVYDVDSTGKAVFVQRGAMALPEAGEQRATFALYPQDWRFEPGHRIGVRIVPGDDRWFTPPTTGSTVEVGAGTLTLPLLRRPRTNFVPGGPSDGMDDVRSFSVPPETVDAGTIEATPPPQEG